MSGFRKFLMQGELVVIAVGLVVALAFSALIKSFTANIITPLINSIAGKASSEGIGWTINGQRIDVGVFIGDVIYFVIFMAVIYFALVVPYRAYMARRGVVVFGDPDPVKTCPFCCAGDLPVAASKCLHCASELPTT